MLKKRNVKQLVIIFSTALLTVGLLLSGIGFAMNDGVNYLKEDGQHKWYQIIYIDQDDNFHIGIKFNNGIQISGF